MCFYGITSELEKNSLNSKAQISIYKSELFKFYGSKWNYNFLNAHFSRSWQR